MSKTAWKISKSILTKFPKPSQILEYIPFKEPILDVLKCYGLDLCNYAPISSDAGNDLTIGTDGNPYYETPEIVTDVLSNPALTASGHSINLDLTTSGSFPNTIFGMPDNLQAALIQELQPVIKVPNILVSAIGTYTVFVTNVNVNSFAPLVFIEDVATPGVIHNGDLYAFVNSNQLVVNALPLGGSGTYNFHVYCKLYPI